MAYQPPQKRAQQAAQKVTDSEPPGDRSQSGKDDRAKGGGKGRRGKSDGEGSNRNVMQQGEGGDWYRRQDGNRRRGVDLTEIEVFGEVKQRSTAGIEFEKYDNIPVQLTGSAAEDVVPIARFSEARLAEALFENLRKCGYERPTPIQKYSIPIVVSGRDLMACAQTGSGKTCAFMVPCLESLLRAGPPPPPPGGKRPSPCGLVLAPTRELALQIHQESSKFAFHTGIRTCIIYGGAEMREQRRELEDGCDILVATPGRLTDMFDRRYVSLALVHFFILDEADRMLDMGFEPQVRKLVEETDMGQKSHRDRQSMMFSATFSKEVQLMAKDFLTEYLFITVGRVGAACELVSQRVVYASTKEHKVRSMEDAIKKHMPKDGLAVVFVETKRGANELEEELYHKSLPVAAIHGDRSQKEREEALAAFKKGNNPILIATDVAARGLDIPHVALVVNFDMPKQLDDYVHRIGRTGRAGRKGVAVALVNEKCGYLNELRDLLSEANQDIPDWYNEMCSASRPRGPRQFDNKFAGQDVRRSAPPPPVAQQPQRADGFGTTGAADSWDD